MPNCLCAVMHKSCVWGYGLNVFLMHQKVRQVSVVSHHLLLPMQGNSSHRTGADPAWGLWRHGVDFCALRMVAQWKRRPIRQGKSSRIRLVKLKQRWMKS